jgi:hypothetical protein
MPQARTNAKPQIVTFKQLLNLAHEKGVKRIITEAITITDGFAFFRCCVVMTDGAEFTGHADATKSNVKPAMTNCLPRMAETRSIVRALRLAVNVGEVAVEELEEYEERTDSAAPSPAPRSKAAIDSTAAMTEQQEVAIRNLCQKRGIDAPLMDGWTQKQAADQIAALSKQPA